MLTGRKIRIAIIDDDEDDYFIIADYIQNIAKDKFIIDWCNNYDEAVKKIKTGQYDIYFVDYRLGTHTGLELLQETSGKRLDNPVVLLTGKGSRDIDIKAMQSGATDYLIKSELNSEKLERCMRYSLDRAADLKELRTRENKYRALFENSKDAVFIGNDHLELKEANHAATLLFAASSEELANCDLFSFIRDDSQKKMVQGLFEKNQDIRDLELEIVSKKGEVKPCLLSLSFIGDSENKKIVHAVLHDITAIKRAELANLHAQKLASNERLMRTLAHEIRNPLNNIGLSLDQFMIPEEDEDEEERHQNLVDIMQRNCVRINHIITELLDLTRPLEMAFKRYSLQHLLDESINYAADRINLQKITLHRYFPNSPLVIAANESKLVLAFTNIMINAIEAMEKGKGELTIKLAETPDSYVVTICDNGKGIPEEYLPKLFEPFFTLKKNGMGLGLATSYTILQSHKAKVHVESKLNQGTSFIITFKRED
ncbi:hybrid sensor histidine kinase/response regulator [Terrimonas pollutisoli]|uniref:hybrid sensor histidine kinase/response regulator n=1 Tax=Terrimonas pollutisoli TaxID=3034147 RepID=UPI0023EC7AFD|nr:ATP-binding protein [Terrimonas sp. H1YJ31]